MSARPPRYAPGSWRARLIAGLRPSSRDARPVRKRGGGDFAGTGWPEVGDGWRAPVETARLRRDAAVAAGPANRVALLAVKAEFGTPQPRVWVVDLSTDAEVGVALAAGHAEAHSARPQEACGEAKFGPRPALVRGRLIRRRLRRTTSARRCSASRGTDRKIPTRPGRAARAHQAPLVPAQGLR